ncbi:synaptotagmin-9-like isoform X3 [Petromyzon marinus]|uniref:synaptotagmin-9-like isoform X3 n=1 Tax=Petromyzon marinus TaxID=7757 RepID=UPI003F712644
MMNRSLSRGATASSSADAARSLLALPVDSRARLWLQVTLCHIWLPPPWSRHYPAARDNTTRSISPFGRALIHHIRPSPPLSLPRARSPSVPLCLTPTSPSIVSLPPSPSLSPVSLPSLPQHPRARYSQSLSASHAHASTSLAETKGWRGRRGEESDRWAGAMPGLPHAEEEERCSKAISIISELCIKEFVVKDRCLDFLSLLPERSRQSNHTVDVDVSVSLLVVIVSFCAIALLLVSLFVSWKLCWLPWRHKLKAASLPAHAKQRENAASRANGRARDAPSCKDNNPGRDGAGKDAVGAVASTPRLQHAASSVPSPATSTSIGAGEQPSARNKRVEILSGSGGSGGTVTRIGEQQAIKISHTSPDIPADVQRAGHGADSRSDSARIQRQVTEPTSSSRHTSFRRQLPRQLNLSHLEVMGTPPSPATRRPSPLDIGRIKPELYKQRSVEGDDADGGCGTTAANDGRTLAGKLNFALHYDYEMEQLLVRVCRAAELPAKDFSGTSDPYVKIYLLPDRKRKYQTKVHRKTLNPVFEETFQFFVPYAELPARRLHFSVYDFDRFSRHDTIGQVVVDNLFEESDLSRETSLWRDIECVASEKDDLGELMFSLCYLPTAGRLTLTVIKARNLKAMDITGASDPYVKVSLMCDGRRLKKRKTSTKKSTLNPVYNEAIVFDVPPESVDQVCLLIAVVDYDRVGHNEVIGVCRVGNDSQGLGRDHWNEMLAYPRKPIAHWHLLQECASRFCHWDILKDFGSNIVGRACSQL